MSPPTRRRTGFALTRQWRGGLERRLAELGAQAGGICGMTDGTSIRTEDDYRAALARADELMDAEAGTPDGDELERLAAAIEAWEDEHYPLDSRA
jgi:hypothetical protein